MPKIGSAGTVHTSIVKRKRKDGSYYVQEVKSQYDPKTKNSRTLSSRTLGILPAGVTDLRKLQPSDNRPFMAARRRAKTKGSQETHAQEVAFSLAGAALVVLLADLAGASSTRQVAHFCSRHAALFKERFDFPPEAAAEEALCSIYKILGRMGEGAVENLAAPLLACFGTGGCPTAGSLRNGDRRGSCRLALFDAAGALSVRQIRFDENEENSSKEASRLLRIVRGMDLSGAVTACGAPYAQKEFADFLISTKRCDYCFSLGKDHGEELAQIEKRFEDKSAEEADTCVLGDSGEGALQIRVLPALPEAAPPDAALCAWAGLDEGSIAVVRAADPALAETSGKFFFVTSLRFERGRVAQALARVLDGRLYRPDEAAGLVVTFVEDRTQCRSADILAGLRAVHKTAAALAGGAHGDDAGREPRQGAGESLRPAAISDPFEGIRMLAGALEKHGVLDES